VTSYYPSLSIANRLHPEHLGDVFCDIYKTLFEQRRSYPKGTAENAMLKLALNGVYGDSNNQYSPFYDPKYTMSITVNGQLLLCMLAEKLMPHMQLIQINTDGLTVRCPRHLLGWLDEVCEWWEQLTGLQLEHAHYSRMFIRDVNNYIAEYNDGKLKRKGAYEYELGWHQNHSMLVVSKAAEAALLRGEDPCEFIMNHDDVYDFMLRTKVPRSAIVMWGTERVANTNRYYISTDGDILQKILLSKGVIGEYKKANGVSDAVYQVNDNTIWSPSIHTKNHSVHEDQWSSIHPQNTVQLCNNIKDCTFTDINYDFYIKEARKLIDGCS
jgi:hypothetical protein